MTMNNIATSGGLNIEYLLIKISMTFLYIKHEVKKNDKAAVATAKMKFVLVNYMTIVMW